MMGEKEAATDDSLRLSLSLSFGQNNPPPPPPPPPPPSAPPTFPFNNPAAGGLAPYMQLSVFKSASLFLADGFQPSSSSAGNYDFVIIDFSSWQSLVICVYFSFPNLSVFGFFMQINMFFFFFLLFEKFKETSKWKRTKKEMVLKCCASKDYIKKTMFLKELSFQKFF